MHDGCPSPEAQAEMFKEEGRGYIRKMYVFDTEIYREVKNLNPTELLAEDNSSLRGLVIDWMSGIKSVVSFFNSELLCGELPRQARHDLKSVGNVLDMNAVYLSETLQECDGEDLDQQFNKVIKIWPFYFSVIEDVLLRGLDETKVEKEFVGTLDIDRLQDAISFIDTNAKETWNQEERQKDIYNEPSRGQYPFMYNNGELFDSIRNELTIDNVEVKGNTSVVVNYLSNALSNALKERIGATQVSLEVSIDKVTSELVLRLIDNGKGMLPEHLDPNHPINKSITRNNKKRKDEGKTALHTYFIFEYGASGDPDDLKEKKSTGLGLANFHERSASMGATLRVMSRRKSSGEESVYTNVPDRALPEVSIGSKHGTIFELRLPIIHKA